MGEMFLATILKDNTRFQNRGRVWQDAHWMLRIHKSREEEHAISDNHLQQLQTLFDIQEQFSFIESHESTPSKSSIYLMSIALSANSLQHSLQCNIRCNQAPSECKSHAPAIFPYLLTPNPNARYACSINHYLIHHQCAQSNDSSKPSRSSSRQSS